ncbi:MAG TPA: ATP-binding protein [Candidatus Elarobacter sp.]|jgi:signal transduction histidine kinase|nr:ATP-binding protein [Candidatus Elarobacter sp.]
MSEHRELVAKLPLERPQDVFVLRQSAREAAAAFGLEQADQVRLATALSELGREVVAHGASASAEIALEGGALVVDIAGFPLEAAAAPAGGLDAARRLVEGLTFTPGDGARTGTVRLRGVLHHARRAAGVAVVRAAIGRVASQPLDELRLENRDLIATLERVEAQRVELVRLNAELEETNRGVMAMYSQLADELEETNRGVVALYAELDDKTLRLNAANEAKSRFLASVSHELRSPVHSVLGLAQLLLDPAAEPLREEQRKQLELMTGSGRELLRLVNDLLDLAKAESGRLSPEIEPVDLAELFSELRGSLRPIARPDVALVVTAPDVPPIETDRALLAQVLRNLLTNALKFTTRGEVRLTASQPAPHKIALTISDTGIGIAPENQPRVFEEFFQVRGELQAQHKGTGLGLPYALRVTQSLGGDLVLTGSEQGRGSVFTVTLPVRWEALLNANASPSNTAPAPTRGRVGTVLIIDDDQSFRAALRGMLQGTVDQILEAGGGQEALRMMRAAPPDLAFVDLRMPDMDGADVLAAMNAEPELRSVPVVIVTASELSSAVRATLGSAAGLLAKANVDPATVARALSEARR